MKTKFNAISEPIKKLKQLQHFFPSAIIAGGAIRDDYMDRFDEINDYDIFLSGNFGNLIAHTSTENLVEQVIDQVFSNPFDIQVLKDSAYLTKEEKGKSDQTPGSFNKVKCVLEVTDDDGTTYQLIYTDVNPITYVENHFDFGFCKTYCDGKKLHYTNDFLTDAKNKTLTVVGENMTKEQVEYCIYHHGDKLSWKYDDFRIVLPPKYQHFIPDTFPAF